MVDTKRLIKALRLNRLSCGIKKSCPDCELMEDCLYYQQNGAKEAADIIECLEAENTTLRKQFQDTFQVHLIEKIERIEQKNAALREQLAEKEIELQSMRNAANQYKQWFTRVTAERDAAIKDIGLATSGRCCKICSRDCIGYEEMTACSSFQWHGPQKEEHGNDN